MLQNEIQILINNSLNDKIFRKYRLSILRAYKKALDEIRLLLAELYERYGEDVTYQAMLKYNRLKSLEKQIEKILKDAGIKFKKENTSAIKETFENSYYKSGYAIESATKINFGFYALSQEKINAAILNPMDRITWIDRATEHGKKLNQFIREKIAQGLIQGKPYSETMREIKKSIDKTATQLIRVVQTETHRAQSMGNLAAYDKIQKTGESIGIEVQKMWQATLDNRTRDTHQELDGQVAGENGLFEIDGYTAEAPGMFGVPELDINCRCSMNYVIDGLTPTKRRDNESDELIEYQNYKQWKENKINKKG